MKIVNACFAFAFERVVGKSQKTPKLSPMADDVITRGGIGCLVSLVYIGDDYRSFHVTPFSY